MILQRDSVFSDQEIKLPQTFPGEKEKDCVSVPSKHLWV